MSTFLVAAVLLSLINHGANLATAWDDKDFFISCPPSKCTKHGPEIRFPFRLKSSNTSCGIPCMGMELACLGQEIILVHPVLGPCKVTAIDYNHGTIKIIPLIDSLSPCPLQKLISRSIPVDVAYAEHQHNCDVYDQDYATVVCFSKEFVPSNDAADSIVGPISCLSNTTHFSYLVDNSGIISIIPSDCKVCLDGVIPIPNTYDGSFSLKASAESILSFAEIMLEWGAPVFRMEDIYCPDCERQGRGAFSLQRNHTFCMRHGIASSWPKLSYNRTNHIIY